MTNPVLGFGRSFLKVFGAILTGVVGGGAVTLRPVDRTADEVAKAISDALDGSGGPYDWNDFKTIPIIDPQLEEIRQRAKGIPLPLDAANCAKLEQLLREAQQYSQGGATK